MCERGLRTGVASGTRRGREAGIAGARAVTVKPSDSVPGVAKTFFADAYGLSERTECPSATLDDGYESAVRAAMAFHAASKLRRTSVRFATSPGYRRDPFASRSRSGTSDALTTGRLSRTCRRRDGGRHGWDVEVTKESEHDEDSLAKARTLAGTLCEVLEHAQDALRTDRNEIRYIEAFARTLSDPGVR